MLPWYCQNRSEKFSLLLLQEHTHIHTTHYTKWVKVNPGVTVWTENCQRAMCRLQKYPSKQKERRWARKIPMRNRTANVVVGRNATQMTQDAAARRDGCVGNARRTAHKWTGDGTKGMIMPGNDARRREKRYGQLGKFGRRAHNSALKADWLNADVKRVARCVTGSRERTGGRGGSNDRGGVEVL